MFTGAAEPGVFGGGALVPTFFAVIRLNVVIRMYNYILYIPKIWKTSSLSKIGYKLYMQFINKISSNLTHRIPIFLKKLLV